jgi:hypothetical protein
MRRPAAAVALTLALAAVPAAALAGSSHWPLGGTVGDGQKTTQAREVGEFTAVRLVGSLDVKVKVGAPRAVAVTIDQNLQPLVETRLDGDTLVIGTKNVSYRGEGRVEVSVPALRAFTIEGSGDVDIEGGQGDFRAVLEGSGGLAWTGAGGKLDVSIEGSGDVKLAGSAQAVRIRIEGSGDVKARGLTAKDADVEVSGSGDVDVTLDGGMLRAEVNGSGGVLWHGKAQVEHARVSGSGEIAHR